MNSYNYTTQHDQVQPFYIATGSPVSHPEIPQKQKIAFQINFFNLLSWLLIFIVSYVAYTQFFFAKNLKGKCEEFYDLYIFCVIMNSTWVLNMILGLISLNSQKKNITLAITFTLYNLVSSALILAKSYFIYQSYVRFNVYNESCIYFVSKTGTIVGTGIDILLMAGLVVLSENVKQEFLIEEIKKRLALNNF